MGLFSKVGKAITGGITGGIKSAASSFIGAAAGKGADALFGSADPYNKHLQRGIQWRVADAKAAGVHPLFALGASIGSPIGTSGSGVQSAVQDSVTRGTQHGFGAPARAEARKMAQQSHGAALTESYTRSAANAAAARRDHAAALEMQSRAARATQRSNVIQDKVDLGGKSVVLPGLGAEITTGPSTTAQQFEDEYGDAASWIYGIGRLGVDTYNAASKKIRKRSTSVVPRGRPSRSDPFRGSALY